MMNVIAHPKLLPDQPPDPLGRPQLGGVPGPLGPQRQNPDQRPALA